MNDASETVLEFLEESQLAFSPAAIRYNLTQRKAISESAVAEAVDELAEYGLLRDVGDDDPLYEITDFGRGYLLGEIDESMLGIDEADDDGEDADQIEGDEETEADETENVSEA